MSQKDILSTTLLCAAVAPDAEPVSSGLQAVTFQHAFTAAAVTSWAVKDFT